MKDKLIYYIIKFIKGKKSATTYAIEMQIQSMKDKRETDWWYWHDRIMEPWKQN